MSCLGTTMGNLELRFRVFGFRGLCPLEWEQGTAIEWTVTRAKRYSHKLRESGRVNGLGWGRTTGEGL